MIFVSRWWMYVLGWGLGTHYGIRHADDGPAWAVTLGVVATVILLLVLMELGWWMCCYTVTVLKRRARRRRQRDYIEIMPRPRR